MGTVIKESILKAKKGASVEYVIYVHDCRMAFRLLKLLESGAATYCNKNRLGRVVT